MVPRTFACYCGVSLIHSISELEPGLPKEVRLDDKNTFR